MKKYKGLNRYITKWRGFLDETLYMRGILITSITGILILSIFVFDIKVSKVIGKIPLLSSVINTKILEEFEAINTNDEFYQAMMSDSEGSHITYNKETESTTIPVSEVITKPIPKDIAIPKAIQDILPEKAKIADVAVRNVSPTEKLFKITLDNGVIRYVQVKKESEKYIIEAK